MNAVVPQRLREADEARAAGSDDWWRLREATLLAIGTQIDLSDDTTGAPDGAAVPAGLDVKGMLSNVLTQDLRADNVPPFLRGRALWIAAKLGRGLPRGEASPFLEPAVAGLGASHPLPVRIGACRAIAQLFKMLEPKESARHMDAVISALVGLLGEVQEDVLLLVIETTEVRISCLASRRVLEGMSILHKLLARTLVLHVSSIYVLCCEVVYRWLQEVCKVHLNAIAPHAPAITAALLSVFPSVAGDIPNTEGIQSLLAVLASAPRALPGMAREGVPLLLAQLRDAAQQSGPQAGLLVEGTLDLLSSFISDSDIGALCVTCIECVKGLAVLRDSLAVKHGRCSIHAASMSCNASRLKRS